MRNVKSFKINDIDASIDVDTDVEIIEDHTSASFNIGDENNNVIVQFKDGHIKTQNFDSRYIDSSTSIDAVSKWSGKTVDFLGDSITAGAQYVNAYQSLTDCTIINHGVGGTHIAMISSTTTSAFENRVDTLSDDADMVIVFGGTNDFGHTSTAPSFGSVTDGPQDGLYTFCAGCHRLFKQLYDKYRDKPVVIMTPIHHGIEVDEPEYTNEDGTEITALDSAFIHHPQATTGKTFKEYVDAIKEIARFYSFIVLDAYSYSGLNPIMEIGSDNRYYFSDGLHLSQSGGNKLARWMYPYLEDVYDIFYKI